MAGLQPALHVAAGHKASLSRKTPSKGTSREVGHGAYLQLLVIRLYIRRRLHIGHRSPERPSTHRADAPRLMTLSREFQQVTCPESKNTSALGNRCSIP